MIPELNGLIQQNGKPSGLLDSPIVQSLLSSLAQATPRMMGEPSAEAMTPRESAPPLPAPQMMGGPSALQGQPYTAPVDPWQATVTPASTPQPTPQTPARAPQQPATDLLPRERSGGEQAAAFMAQASPDSILGFLGRGMSANQQQDRQREAQTAVVKHMQSSGRSPDEIRAALASPDIMKQVTAQLYQPKGFELAPDHARYGQDGREIARNNASVGKPVPMGPNGIFDPRTSQVIQPPVDPMMPIAPGGGVLNRKTGEITAGPPKELSATDRNAIFKAENELPAVANTLDKLKRAAALNSKIYGGITAGARGWLDSRTIGTEAGVATDEWAKLMSSTAIAEMSDTLKGASTDFEMRKFLALIADPSTPAETRARTIEQATKLAEHSQTIMKDRIDQLRGGTYYKPQGGASRTVESSDDIPEGKRVRDTATGKIMIKRGGKLVPEGS